MSFAERWCVLRGELGAAREGPEALAEALVKSSSRQVALNARQLAVGSGQVSFGHCSLFSRACLCSLCNWDEVMNRNDALIAD